MNVAIIAPGPTIRAYQLRLEETPVRIVAIPNTRLPIGITSQLIMKSTQPRWPS